MTGVKGLGDVGRTKLNNLYRISIMGVRNMSGHAQFVFVPCSGPRGPSIHQSHCDLAVCQNKYVCVEFFDSEPTVTGPCLADHGDHC